MKTTHSYPTNRFAFQDPPQVAPVRAAPPSPVQPSPVQPSPVQPSAVQPNPVQSGGALPDKGGPGDAPEAMQAQPSADKEPGRPILHLNTRP